MLAPEFWSSEIKTEEEKNILVLGVIAVKWKLHALATGLGSTHPLVCALIPLERELFG